MKSERGVFAESLQIVREHRQAYLIINAGYYGLTLVAMFVVAFFPSVQESLIGALKEGFERGPLRAVGIAYSGGHVIGAISFTFAFNLIAASFLTITIPSLIIPFSGFVMGVVRATLWGLLFGPTSWPLALAMIPHSLTLLLEGQAYILALLAVWVHGRSFVAPQSAGAVSCGEGYRIGLRKTVRLYLLVAVLLAVSAVYEELEVIYVAPLLIGKS